MTNQQRQNIALQVISHITTVSGIEKQDGVSRKLVGQKKENKLCAIDQIFEEENTGSDNVLFYLYYGTDQKSTSLR